MLNLQSIEQSLGFGSPTELYLFEYGDESFAYTSGSKKVLHTDGIVYSPLPIKRGKLQRTQEDFKNKLRIELPGDSSVPMIFRNKQPSKHVTIRVFRYHRYVKDAKVHFDSLSRDFSDGTVCIFSGEVVSCSWDNTIASIECAPVSALQRRQTLRFGYQAQCNHHVFDELCGLKIQDWQEDVTVTSIQINGFRLVVASKSGTNDYYRGGLISRSDSDFRDVSVVSGTTIDIVSPFDGLKVGDVLQLTKGCDRSASSCQSFSNFDNFFGCLTIPTENPFK